MPAPLAFFEPGAYLSLPRGTSDRVYGASATIASLEGAMNESKNLSRGLLR